MSSIDSLGEKVAGLQVEQGRVRESVDNLTKKFDSHASRIAAKLDKDDERHERLSELIVKVSERVSILLDPNVPCQKAEPFKERISRLEGSAKWTTWFIRGLTAIVVIGSIGGMFTSSVCNTEARAAAAVEDKVTTKTTATLTKTPTSTKSVDGRRQ